MEWGLPVRIVGLDQRAIGQRLVYNLVDAHGRVLLSAGTPLTSRYLALLQGRGYVSIPVEDALGGGAAPSDPIPEPVRTRITDLVGDSVKRAERGLVAVTPGIRAAVNDVLACLLKSSNLTYNLLSLHSLEDYFFVHSVNVCVYSLVIAGGLALDPVDRRSLGIGALLHDIGMIYYRELMERPGVLTPEDLARIARHTEEGFELLRRQQEVDLRAAHVAFQHHERLDGSGYPRGIDGDRISPWARIVAIAEVFDSITSSRTYAPTKSTAEALDLLEADAQAQKLDPYLVRYFLQRMSRHPAGTIVRMGDGAVGVVLQGDVPGQGAAQVRIVSNDGERLEPGTRQVEADGSAPSASIVESLPDYPAALAGAVEALPEVEGLATGS